MRVFLRWPALGAGLALLLADGAALATPPLFTSNFEKSVLPVSLSAAAAGQDSDAALGALGWQRVGTMPEISSEQARSGQYSMKAYLNKTTSPTPYRTMVGAAWSSTSDTTNRAAANVPFFGDTWIGFSLFLPKSGAGNWLQVSNTYEDLLQWHDSHKYPTPAWDTEESKNPLFAVFISDTNHLPARHWNLSWLGESRTPYPTTGSPRPWHYESTGSIDLGSIDPDLGVWTDFVVRIRWNFWKVGSTGNVSPMGGDVHDNVAGSPNCGLIQIWKNGVLVLDRSPVQIGSNDNNGPMLSVGIYKGWRTQAQRDSDRVVDRTVYFDDFRYGGPGTTYADVAPGKGPSPKPPTDIRIKQ